MVCEANLTHQDLPCFDRALDAVGGTPATDIIRFASMHYNPLVEIAGMLNETMFLLKSQAAAINRVSGREDL
jgi:hypothetical protein